MERSIICSFLNQPLDRQKECNASITYDADCNQELGNYSAMGTGANVTIPQLALIHGIGSTEYCYSVTASSNNTTVVVEGDLDIVNIQFGNMTSLLQ